MTCGILAIIALSLLQGPQLVSIADVFQSGTNDVTGVGSAPTAGPWASRKLGTSSRGKGSSFSNLGGLIGSASSSF